MSQTDDRDTITIEKGKLIDLIIPSLDIMWGIHCNVQGHPCPYQPKVKFAINGLTELLYIVKGPDCENKNPV